MNLLIWVGSFAGAILLFVLLGFTRLRRYRLMIIAVVLVINYFGLSYTRHEKETTLFGSTDFISGTTGNCERLLNEEQCYSPIDFKGYPFKAISIRYIEKDGRVIESYGYTDIYGLGSPRGSGFIANIVVISVPVILVFYVLSIYTKKNKNHMRKSNKKN